MLTIKTYRIAIMLIALLAQNRNFAQDTASLKFSAAYTGDLFFNAQGGIKQGHSYHGLADISASYTPHFIKGGEFNIHFENTHGATPSETFIGDMQIASNIENGNNSFLYEIWYSQKLKDFQFQIGKIDLNADFMTSENAGEFMNGSFGIMPTASINFPASLFPKTSAAVRLNYTLTEDCSIQVGVFDGDPLDLESDPYGLDFGISSDDGFLTIAEICIQKKSNTFKSGFLYHTSDFKSFDQEDVKNWSVYFIDDHRFNLSEKHEIGLFLKGGYSPQNRNCNDIFLGCGINSFSTFKAGDVLGIGLAYAAMSHEYCEHFDAEDQEAAVELTYKFPLTPQFCIQPDMQYIINPSADKNIDNALVFFIRGNIEF